MNEKEKKANAASDPIMNLEYIFQYKIQYILQQEESLRLLKVWVMTWSVPDRIIMSILRGRCGMVNIHPVLNLTN